MFRIVQVDRQRAESVEWLGSKRKFWFVDGPMRWLFKAEERGTGEDWAEKIACELCERIGLPHVHYELAEEFDKGIYLQPGVVCPHLAPRPRSLVLGNQLLWDRDPDYPKTDVRKYRMQAHTVEAVSACVAELDLPPLEWLANLPERIGTARGIFLGYLMLDAWVANQDRHHENWGAIALPGAGRLCLAPTFDHGASLARNLSDEERRDRLESHDEGRQIPHFASRARSGFYASPADTRALGTFAAFRAMENLDPNAARIWLDRLRGVTKGEMERIVREIPPNRMTDITRRFTLELLTTNQQRLLQPSVG